MLIHIALHGFEEWCSTGWPAEDLLILCWCYVLHPIVVYAFHIQRYGLKSFKNLDAPTALELVHKSACQDSLARAVAQVDEGATGDVECVVPALWVIVLIRLLYPSEDLAE